MTASLGPTRVQFQKFAARWRELCKEQANLDWRKAEWCRDVRETFGLPPTGDEQFVNYCTQNFDMQPGQAREMLDRARLAKLVPDALQWNALGGFKGIAPALKLPVKQQAEAVRTAQREVKAVATIVRERTQPKEASKKLADAPVHQPKIIARSAGRDLAELAKWCHRHVKEMPAEIRVIVDMYK